MKHKDFIIFIIVFASALTLGGLVGLYYISYYNSLTPDQYCRNELTIFEKGNFIETYNEYCVKLLTNNGTYYIQNIHHPIIGDDSYELRKK